MAFRMYLVLVLLVTACAASTKYKPMRPNHAYLVLDRGKLSYSRNGKVEPVQSPEAGQLLSCSAQAHALVQASRSDASTAQSYATVGVLFGLVGALITTPAAISYQRRALSESVDAMNVHNDTAACTQNSKAGGSR